MKQWQFCTIKIISICSLLTSLFVLYLFIWHKKDYVGWDYALATDAVGQYGDFIGGVIGTILSVVLLYFTLTLQREDSTKNSQIYENQQLNDKFFRLLNVYDSILQSLSFNDDDNYYVGKVAVHKYVEDLYDGFDATARISVRRKIAVASYQDFYAKERDFAPVYFRVLYRICEIVHNSDCTELQKVEYMKILRAQLTDSELILLRYNAMTPLGKNFTYYINKYNLLKHIPIFLLFEYKEWRRQLVNVNAVFKTSALFQTLKGEMSNMLEGAMQKYERSSSHGKYHLIITCNKDKTKIHLAMQRKRNVVLQDWDDFAPLDNFSHDSLVSLLRYYIKDCFVLNSFNLLNKRKDLALGYSEHITDGVEYIETWVENTAINTTVLKL